MAKSLKSLSDSALEHVYWIALVENWRPEGGQKTLYQQKKAELQYIKLNLHMGDTQLCDKHVHLSFSALFHFSTQCICQFESRYVHK